MQPGETVNLTIARQTVAGRPATGKLASDFAISAWLDGASTSVSPAWTEIGPDTDGKWQEYKLAIVAPGTTGRLKIVIQPASGFDVCSPSLFEGELESNDIDSVASLLLMAQGQPSVLSAADASLGDVVDGDSYASATLTMPAGKLSPFGITNISSGGITVEAAIMDVPGGTSYPITTAVVSGPGLTFNISWAGGASQPFPALTTAPSKPWCIDVQVIKSGSPNTIVTTNRYSFNQVWQRDTRSS